MAKSKEEVYIENNVISLANELQIISEERDKRLQKIILANSFNAQQLAEIGNRTIELEFGGQMREFSAKALVDLGFKPKEIETIFRNSANQVAKGKSSTFISDLFEDFKSILKKGGKIRYEKSDIDQLKEAFSNRGKQYFEQFKEVEFDLYTRKFANAKEMVDRYKRDPWLKYTTKGDHFVRPAHVKLNGITKRARDPFWISYLPPLDYNCRCRVEEVEDDKEAIEVDLDELKSDRNPSAQSNILAVIEKALEEQRQGKVSKSNILLPPKHPYIKALKNIFY